MSRRGPTTNLNTSFGASSISNTGPTVISAIRKLKEESEMLLRQHKRYRVLNHQISRENMRQSNKVKQEVFFSAVKNSAEYDKQIKREAELKKIEEVKKRFSVNLKHRELNKQMIQNVRRSFHNANHELYEQIRQKRKQNQDIVTSQRSFVLQSRVVNRRKAEQEERQRRLSIQNFHSSRVQKYRSKKEEEIQDILRKSQERRQFCEALQSRNSRIRQNKLSLSRSLSNHSLHNPENSRSQS